MIKRILAIMMLFPLLCSAAERPGKRLASLLETCLSREEIVPDSIYCGIRQLEAVRHTHPVYTAALARLYAERAFLAQVYERETPSPKDSLREWSRVEWYRRSQALFREVLANQDLLHGEHTKDWLPLVKRGRQDKVFGSDMLYVVWRAMQSSLPDEYWRKDSLLSMDRLIAFYKEHEMKEAVHWLTWERNDSLSLLTPSLGARVASTVYPGKDVLVALSLHNMREVTLKVMCGKKTVRKLRIPLPSHHATEHWKDTVSLGTLPAGHYKIILDGKAAVRLLHRPKSVETALEVCPQKVFTMGLPDGSLRLWKVDAMTGAPMDTLLVDTADMYRHFQYSPPSLGEQRRTSIFTDRPIYRPGQQVQVGGVVYTQRHWDARVVSNLNIPVILRDAYNRAIDTVWVQTDTLGVFSCNFTLPEHGRTGTFSVHAGSGSRHFSVEEYRRPTFFVTLSMDSTLVQGVVTGYNGVPVRRALVTATASRLACWWYHGMQTPYQLDTLYTDSEGHFSYTLPSELIDKSKSFFPRLRVKAVVQSETGEVQEASAFQRLFPDPPQPEEEENPWARSLSDTLYIYETLIASRHVLRDTMWIATDTLFLPDTPYEKRYGEGAVATWTYVKDGELYHEQRNIPRPLPQDTLRYRWDTFRDRVRPGSKERWALTVTRKDGTPVSANVMLTLYDASLDALASQPWSLHVSRYSSLPWASFDQRGDFSPFSLWLSVWMTHWAQDERVTDFSRFDDLYFSPRYERSYPMRFLRLKPVRVSARKSARAANDYAVLSASDAKISGLAMRETAFGAQKGAVAQEDAVEEEESLEGKALRSDFSETSFFYPALRTDSQGRVTVVFTLPESLTSWHLRGLTHTATLESLTFSDTVIAQKPLMAELQLPRFLRRGDEVSITATVSNISDGALSGHAVLEILNGETERVIRSERVPFSLASHKDTVYTFRLSEYGASQLICRWQAESADASDGEQRALPVLSDVEHITSSEALSCTPEELERMRFDHLFPEGSTNRQLRKVVTDPVTAAKEALPELTLPRHSDVWSLLGNYYAQTLLQAMHSSKATVFAREYCLSQLARLQCADGHFAWFPGMKGNEWITREVVRQLRRLNRLMLHSGEDPSSSLFTLHAALLRKAETLVGKALDEEHALALKDAPNVKRRLTHPDGYYLSFPGGFLNSVDDRIARNVDALELMLEAYPKDTIMHRGIRRWILDQRRTEGWKNPWLTVCAVYALLCDSAVAGREQWVGVMADYDLPVQRVRSEATGISLELSHSVPDVQRITILATRNFDYVHLTVPRSSLAEPISQNSGYGWKDGFMYYREVHDDRTEYFIEQLPQGTYVFEEKQRLTRSGSVSTGVAKIECLYAPEFRAHTASQNLKYQRK